MEAKLTKFGGMPGVIVPTPDISSFKIDSEVDFLVLGCNLKKNFKSNNYF